MAVQHVMAALFLTVSLTSAFVLPKDSAIDSQVLDLFKLERSKRETEERPKPQGNPIIALINSMFENADTQPHDGQLDEDEFWGTFNTYDGDGDGLITLREYVGFFSLGLLPGLRGMPNLSRTAAVLFDEGDMDGDRFLSQNDATIIFYNLDKNDDHHVSKAEYFARWKEVLERIERHGQAAGQALT